MSELTKHNQTEQPAAGSDCIFPAGCPAGWQEMPYTDSTVPAGRGWLDWITEQPPRECCSFTEVKKGRSQAQTSPPFKGPTLRLKTSSTLAHEAQGCHREVAALVHNAMRTLRTSQQTLLAFSRNTMCTYRLAWGQYFRRAPFFPLAERFRMRWRLIISMGLVLLIDFLSHFLSLWFALMPGKNCSWYSINLCLLCLQYPIKHQSCLQFT